MSSRQSHYGKALQSAFRLGPDDNTLAAQFRDLLARIGRADVADDRNDERRARPTVADAGQTWPTAPTWRSSSS